MGTANPNVIHRRRIGRYETLFRIAAGGMAEVYAGRVTGEAGFEKLVAVKSMLPNIAEDEEFIQMFLDEARLAANIDHPNVVSTRDLGRDEDGSLFIVMDLVVGVTLSKLLRNSHKAGSQIELPIAVELLAQAAAGLDAAHNAVTPLGDRLEIVHRDVSPQNVLVGVDGRARITDFGVARALQRITHTTGDRFKGKFGYSAPEQLQGAPLDCRADVFSLGIVAWELLTYRRLFAARTPAETVARILGNEVPGVRTYREEVPDDLEEVIASCLERDPGNRPSSGAEVEARLRACLAKLGGKPRSSDLGEMVAKFGGESLRALRENIHMSLSVSLPSPAALELVGDESGEIDLSVSEIMTEDAQAFAATQAERGDETVSLSSPRAGTPPLGATVVSPAPIFARGFDEVSGIAARVAEPSPRPSRRKLVFGLVLAALLVVGLMIVFGGEQAAQEQLATPVVEDTSALTPEVEEPTAEAAPPASPEEPSDGVADASVGSDEPVITETPERPSEARRRARRFRQPTGGNMDRGPTMALRDQPALPSVHPGPQRPSGNSMTSGLLSTDFVRMDIAGMRTGM